MIAKPFGYQGDSGAFVDRYDILKRYSRENRKQPTDAEKALWNTIRSNQMGVRFRRQHIIGDYIVDFVSLRHHLIVELDGKYHNRPDQQEEDAMRERFLESCGFHILRFSNEQVFENPEQVANQVITEIKKQNN